MTSLFGKTAVVTWASHGTGRAIALNLAREGAQVLVHYSRDPREADRVVSEIRAMGTRSEKINADLSAPDGPHKLAKRAREIIGGRLDILAATAEDVARSPIENLSIDGFDQLFALNVRAPLFLVQQLRPVLCVDSSVILIRSPGAPASKGSFPAYAAAADALETIVKHLAVSFGRHGIRINAVSPPSEHEDVVAYVDDSEAGGHSGYPADISAIVGFLASDAARWITGETIRATKWSLS